MMPSITLENAEPIVEYSLSKRQNRRLNLFWAGFFLYTAAYSIDGALTNAYTIISVIQAAGMMCIVAGAFNLVKYRFDSKYLSGIFTVYFAWLIFVVVSRMSFSIADIKFVLLDGSIGLFVYLAPLIMLFPLNLGFFKKLFSFILVLGILYLICDLAFAKILLNPDRTPNLVYQFAAERLTKFLAIPTGFLLLTLRYHTRKRQMLAIIIIVVDLLLMIYRARRGLMVICAANIVFAFLIYIGASRSKFMIIALAIVVTFFGYFLVADSVNHQSNLFGFLVERNDEDTRTSVEENLYADMQTKDWIIGKGIMGEYYCPGIDLNETNGYRNSIETDYLTIILKGGIVSLALLLLIAIPAAFKGIFYSKNVLAKAAGFWILLWMVSLYPSNVTTFSLNYLLVWISIGICYSKELRNIPEETLFAYFRNDEVTLTSDTY